MPKGYLKYPIECKVCKLPIFPATTRQVVHSGKCRKEWNRITLNDWVARHRDYVNARSVERYHSIDKKSRREKYANNKEYKGNVLTSNHFYQLVRKHKCSDCEKLVSKVSSRCPSCASKLFWKERKSSSSLHQTIK